MLEPIELKGKKKKSLPITRDYKDGDYYVKEVNLQVEPVKGKRIPHWYAFAIPLGLFIANKAIQSVLGFTTDTNTIIDVGALVLILVGLGIYARIYLGGKNG